jgi:hypothetical protein
VLAPAAALLVWRTRLTTSEHPDAQPTTTNRNRTNADRRADVNDHAPEFQNVPYHLEVDEVSVVTATEG